MPSILIMEVCFSYSIGELAHGKLGGFIDRVLSWINSQIVTIVVVNIMS